ncbi:hypothetical protein M0805_001360 [Coniferiporia weirii]|nr:hypothetical protein M0805_001360 [Coniferiporia weirii]
MASKVRLVMCMADWWCRCRDGLCRRTLVVHCVAPKMISWVTGYVSLMPTYTFTDTLPTLAPDTFTAVPKTLSVGDGWADPSDTGSRVTEIARCNYPDPWFALGLTLPTTTCTGSATPARLARRMPVTPHRRHEV